MDKIRQKAQSLLEKLHDKYGIQPKHHFHVVVATMGKKEGEDTGLQDHWYLVDTHSQKFRLPKTMLFLGREECDVVVASQSVDKRHAVLTFDLYLNRFKVKDLSTTNGTFVNNSRIPEQEYVALNHMDSIRLGYDAMMYHIEQGSQITNQGGQLPDPQFIPSWASRHPQDPTAIHVHAHTMAECQGCIAEQNIEHSCGLRTESKGNENDVRIHNSEHHCHLHQEHHHHHPPHHHPQVQPQQQHPADVCQPSQDPGSDQIHHQHHQSHHQAQPHPSHHEETAGAGQDQAVPEGDQTDDTEDFPEDLSSTPKVGRNTWPRKRVRPMAHVSTLFNQDGPENSENTASEARPAGTMSSMYFVSFDDSVCNGSSSGSSMDAKRRPRSSRNSFSTELATVKKGTPLYGQPAWWGEGDDAEKPSKTSKQNGDEKGANKTSRPSSLGLGKEEVASNTAATTSKAPQMDSQPRKHQAGSAYMEISLKDDDSPEGGDKTPAKSITSSLSKDSLSASPDVKQSYKSAKEPSPGVEKNPATSFTIDLDDPEHPPKKSLNIGSSLSEFVPPKIRRNFQERERKDKASSKESTPSKTSEERELSPLSSHKIEEIWSTVVEGKGKASRLSSSHGALAASLRSPNLEDIDRLSELSEERRSMERDGDKRSAKKPVPSKSPLALKVTSKAKPSTLASGPKGSTAVAHSSASVSMSQYSDPTSYLIDKMFEGKPTASAQGTKDKLNEQKLSKEAANLDKAGIRRSSTEKPVSKVDSAVPETQSTQAAVSKNHLKEVPLKKTVKPAVCDDDDDLMITEDVKDTENIVEVKEDKEDKVSEAGTYTIEGDEKEGEEEEEARQRIDKVFGVDVDDFTSDKPVIDPLRLSSPGGYDNVYDDSDDGGNKTPYDDNGDFTLDDDDDLTLDDDYMDENGKEDSDMATTEDVQTWVSQLTALTNQRGSGMSADDAKLAKEDGDGSLSKKPPQGLSRKRPGTGRRLPSIPTDKSPVSSEHSSYVTDQEFFTGDDVTASNRTPDLVVNGKNNGFSSGKSSRISSQNRARHNTYTCDNGLPQSASQDGLSNASPKTSARSRGSVDTELLLQDTETVMAAMESRIAYKSSHGKRNSHSTDDDTDASSTVALVNGDESYRKPTLFQSPRDALSKKQQKDLSATKNTSSTPPASPGRRPMGRSLSQTVSSKARSVASPRSTSSSTVAKKSVVSDVYSRRDSTDNESVISDVSSDVGDGNLSRSSSKGKGTITMTKPNRAFQLRRARADSVEEPTTPRSAKSTATAKSGASGSSARSSSVQSSTRTRTGPDTNRSNATSLGGQIVRKSRSNAAQDKALKASSSTNLARTDPVKNNGRLQRASSLTIAQSSIVPAPSNKREPTPKSHLRSTPTGMRQNLSISGISSRSQSQPGSRSNSPKAAERAAWKRRKEYDPRKAVADAKAKTKDGAGPSGVTMRPKPKANANYRDRRMIRSASFTNSAELSVHDSGASSSNFGSTDRSYGERGFRGAFIPFHNSLRSERSHHSADEDDSIVSANSTQDSTRSLVSLNVSCEPKSAFTPPLILSKAISPRDSPPSLVSPSLVSLRRRTQNGDCTISATEPLASDDLQDNGQTSVESPPQASYDSLIVSSIYQLSLKLKTTTDKTLGRLRDEDRVSHTPSPIDDFLSDSSRSEITAFKSANQELAGVLKNLRKLERHVQMMNTVLFPEDDMGSDVSPGLRPGRREKQKYVQEIERIRSELAGFQPIDNPHLDESEIASPEMAELSGQF